MSTELEPAASTEVTEAQRNELSEAVKAKFNARDLVLPMLNLTQQLSKLVTDEKAKSGQFVNSLTGENYGESLELIVVDYFDGRFWEDKDSGRTFATQSEIIPDFWPHPDAGRRFDESADAEEVWKEQSNDGTHEWGNGPPIQTTKNFVGFIPGEDDVVPVRLSLKSTGTATARKIITLIQVARAPWSYVFDLGRVEQRNKQDKPYYVVEAVRGRPTTPEEVQRAVDLALALQRSQVVLHGDEGDESAKPAKPAAREDALEV